MAAGVKLPKKSDRTKTIRKISRKFPYRLFTNEELHEDKKLTHLD